MRIAIYDLEVTAFSPHNGILLCGAVKEYQKKMVKVFRSDNFRTWKTNRSDDSLLIKELKFLL